MNEMVKVEEIKIDQMELETIKNMEFPVVTKEKMHEITTFLEEEHSYMLNNFSKSQSNFMDSMFVFHAQTPIRNIRQISAEIEKKKMALAENQFRLKKKDIKIKQKIRKFEREQDDLKKELIGVQIAELVHGKEQALTYIEAALKTILNMKQQYESILENKGISDVSEIDFEREEEEYHIKQACHQAFEDIVASGRISVGNNKYFLQQGIMPNAIHDILVKFLGTPAAYDKGAFDQLLEDLYQKFKGSSKKEADSRGLNELFYENSLFSIEHKREIQEKCLLKSTT